MAKAFTSNNTLVKQSSQGDALLAAHHVSLIYDDAHNKNNYALDNISIELHAAERLCILGANGSGKSTLASVLCGLLAPDTGDVRLLGEQVCQNGKIDLEAYRRARRGIGLVFQNPGDQIVTSVVAEDVAFGPENLGVPSDEIAARVERELHRVALDAYADADPRRLSGGQQQRVAIAGALAMEPQAIIFDEPGALLDVRGRRSILHVMDRLRDAGVAVAHITHYMEEALGADRVVVLDHGKIALEGTPAEIFSQKNNLAALGLEWPFAARLARKLRERGLPIPWVSTDKELLAELGKLKSISVASPAKNSTTVPQAASVLAAQQLSFSYTPQHKALENITITIPAGSRVSIVGQTGSGKSTLLRLLCALELPDEGKILIYGQDSASGGQGRRGRAWRAKLRSRVGYVMQRPERQLFANTVAEDIAFGPSNQGLSVQEVQKRVEEAIEICGLQDKRTASPFELSGGQQRLCAIAGVLATKPKVLVLDEPTAGLDPHGRQELYRLLSLLNAQGVTIVQVTHSINDAANSQIVYVLNQSHLLAASTPQEIFCRANQQELRSCGLGLPLALQWAIKLEEAGFIQADELGQPLTIDELADSLASKYVAKEMHDGSQN